jgi:hypothetical protein
MATCVCKQVTDCPSIFIMHNGLSVHNPVNVDAHNIYLYLTRDYHGIFDISYNERKLVWLNSQGFCPINFERIELLRLHSYDDAIEERKEERSMKDVELIGIREQNLHSMQDYVEGLIMILSINDDVGHLKDVIAPIVADWPGQLFIRKALTYLFKNHPSIPQEIVNFLPIIGPLHVSLNSREQVIKTYHFLFEKFFHFVFGDKKVLAKKPKPWRINLLLELINCGWKKIRTEVINKFGDVCKDIEYRMIIDLLDNIVPTVLDVYAILFQSGSFDQYLESIFRIWTFALRWKRHNYNKAPLVFLSDVFYWKDIKHPFFEAIKNYLVNFNDYYVENMHSRLRANISPTSSTENIIKHAYVISKCIFNCY